MTAEALVNVKRGPIVESIHYGNVAVVDATGKLLYYAGDPYRVAYLRSSAKPLQTLNALLSGAVDKYQFTDKEVAIMCASHFGEDFHRETILGMLEKIGMKLEDLRCGTPYSYNYDVMKKQMEEHFELNTYNSDCSGKHSGFLATCLTKGYSTEGYDLPDHPLQKDVNEVLAYMFGVKPEEMYIGEDGCGVPVHGVTVYNMALGFAKLANPAGLKEGYPEACARVFKAMNAHPEMIAGTNGFCTEFIKNTNGKAIGKLGAEGVFCIALKEQGLGIAVKIEDGDTGRSVPVAAMRAIMDLGILTEAEAEVLAPFISAKNINHHKREVGEIEAAYHLRKVGVQKKKGKSCC